MILGQRGPLGEFGAGSWHATGDPSADYALDIIEPTASGTVQYGPQPQWRPDS